MKNDNERAEEVMGSYTWLLIILSVILSVLMLIFGKYALMDQSFGHAFCLVQGAQPLLSYIVDTIAVCTTAPISKKQDFNEQAQELIYA